MNLSNDSPKRAKISSWGVFFKKFVGLVVLSNHYGYQIHEK